jgi:hypothetical protein
MRPSLPAGIFLCVCRFLFNVDLLLPLICSLVLVCPLYSQSNAVTLPRNLAQLVDESDSIVQGHVTSVSLEPHPQLRKLLMVVVTVQVEETLKGQNASTYTFDQAVIDKRDQQQKMGYRVGQHLLLAMIRPSAYGLSSPAGMQQGRFEISSGPDGKARAMNGFANAGLFHGMDSQLKAARSQLSLNTQEMFDQQKSGPVALEDLKTVIRTLTPGKTTP